MSWKARVVGKSDPEALERFTRAVQEDMPGAACVDAGGREATFLVPTGDAAAFERYAKLAGCEVVWLD